MKIDKEENYQNSNDEIIELKFKPWQMIGYGLVAIIYFVASYLFIIYSFGIFGKEKVWWAGLITLPMGLFFVLDLPLFINHFLFEVFRRVTYNQTTKVLRIKSFGKETVIDLKQDHYKVIRFKPKEALLEKVPGQGFGKIVIVKGNKSISFSEIILDKSYLWLNLLNLNTKDNIKEVRRQINFIW